MRESTVAANSCRVTISAASRMAPGGMVPGSLRAAFWTNRWARHEASSARPSHSEDHSRCAVGSIVWAEMSPNGSSRMSAASPLASRVKPSEQVPRKPRVSQPLSGVRVTAGVSQTARTWSLGGLSASRRAVVKIASAYSP